MIHPYQLHSLSKLYHEEALQVAHSRHLQGLGRKHPAGRARRSKGLGPG